jgi:hypothetical protein
MTGFACGEMALIGASLPFAADRGLDAVAHRAEPALHLGDRGQVVRLLGRIRGDHAHARRQSARDRRAGVAHHDAARVRDDVAIAAAVGDLADGARRVYPELHVGMDLPAFQQMRDQLHLLDGIVRAAEHDEIDLAVGRALDLLVGLAALRAP